MYIEVSDEVERKQIKTRDGSVYDIVEQAVAWHVPGKTFSKLFMMRVEQPLESGRYFFGLLGMIETNEQSAQGRFEGVGPSLSAASGDSVVAAIATLRRVGPRSALFKTKSERVAVESE